MGIFKKINKIGGKVIGAMSPDSTNDASTAATTQQDAGISNQILLDCMVRQFRFELEKESVGRRMLYPMAFRILMTPDDYNDRKHSLRFILSEIVAAFYGVIQEKSAKFHNFTPVSNKWYFCFMPFEGDPFESDGPSEYIVTSGNPVVLASLYTSAINFDSPNVTAEANVKVSVVCNNSMVGNCANLNLAAIGRVDELDEGVFTFPFDMELPQDSEKVERTAIQRGSQQQHTGNTTVATGTGAGTPPPTGIPMPPPRTQPTGKVYAKLTYQMNSVNYTYEMTDTYITISGSNDMRINRQIFKINKPGLLNDHVMIRYNNGNFEIAANGKTRLNSRELTPSRGATTNWTSLANNSHIFINDEVLVTFKRN